MSEIPPARAAFENGVVLLHIFSHLADKDLVNCAVLNKTGCRTAAIVLYETVGEGVCEGMAGKKCPLSRIDFSFKCVRHLAAVGYALLEIVPTHRLRKIYPNLCTLSINICPIAGHRVLATVVLQDESSTDPHLVKLQFPGIPPNNGLNVEHPELLGRKGLWRLVGLQLGREHYPVGLDNLPTWDPLPFLAIKGRRPKDTPRSMAELPYLELFNCTNAKIFPGQLNSLLTHTPKLRTLQVVVRENHRSQCPSFSQQLSMINDMESLTELGLWSAPGSWNCGDCDWSKFGLPALKTLHMHTTLASIPHTKVSEHNFDPPSHGDLYWPNLSELHMWSNDKHPKANQTALAMQMLYMIPRSCRVIFHPEWTFDNKSKDGTTTDLYVNAGLKNWIVGALAGIELIRRMYKVPGGWKRLTNGTESCVKIEEESDSDSDTRSDRSEEMFINPGSESSLEDCPISQEPARPWRL